MFKLIALSLLVLLVSGCGRTPEQSDHQARAQRPAGGTVLRQQSAAAMAIATNQAFATLPDRGDLVRYPGIVREMGAYTWHRADLSEQHALHAIVTGHLRVTTPEGKILDVDYDRHIEHPSGDWTWIGHIEGHPGQQTILTFGERAAFGSIAQMGALPLRLTLRDGASWLVETDAQKVALLGNAATKPDHLDYHIVPQSRLPSHRAAPTRTGAKGGGIIASAAGKTTDGASALGAPTVDLLIGYTPGMVSALGSASAVQTRLNYLVDVTNEAYQNSQIDAQLRLVKSMLVNYSDASDNNIALKELSGYDVDAQKEIPPAAAFTALRDARETYGADLVSLVRDFTTPENNGCGVAWLLGGQLQGISAGQGWDTLGYSVVSDGIDTDESDNKSYYCLDETLAHELGHNMGAAHDVETAKGDDGVLDNPDDYGAYIYSFGYKTATPNSYYTIMAYGDKGQQLYRTFSNPQSTFCGGSSCGTANTPGADNARTLRQTIPVVAGFRGQTYLPRRVYADFDGDGVSDLLWRHVATGSNTIWLSANKSTQLGMSRVGNLSWEMKGIGDFNGDGRADVVWRNNASGADTIWRSGNAGAVQAMSGVANLAWKIVGVGDFNGDGVDDVLWRNSITGANTIWKSADISNQQRMTTITDLNWQVVGVGDFNQDGKSDILWRHAKTGANVIWRSGDYGNQQAVTRVSNLYWQVRGVGDFDGDAVDDILWRNASTGADIIWLSANGATQRAVTRIGNLSWHMESVGDYDGDGRADIMWRNANSGADVLWPAANYAQQITLGGVADLNWQVQPRPQ